MAGNQILVVRGGAIGDFILTLPVLAALREHFPGTRLEVLGYPHIAALAAAGGWADAVHPIEARALAGFFAKDGTLAPELQAYFAGFAVILSYLYDPDGIFEENVRRCTKGQFIAGPHRPDDSGGVHATRVLLKPLERLAVWDADPAPRLKLAPLPSGFDSDTPVLALHPGSGGERKNWPEPRWVELLERLAAETAWGLLLAGGEAEGDRLERLAAKLPSGRVALARSRPLPELARLLAGCRGFVGHDSGITHLAAAVGTPSLALWGATVEAVWRPAGAHVQLAQGPEGLESLAVDEVLARLKRMMA